MMPADRRRERSAAASRDRWVIPYADLVTLLFAFFTALYAVASVDAGRLPALTQGSSEAVGARVPQRPPLQGAGVLPAHPALIGREGAPDGGALRAAIERALGDDLTAGRIEMLEDRRGLVLAIPEAF